MDILIAFLIAVAAGIVTDVTCPYIRKWLDRHFSKN